MTALWVSTTNQGKISEFRNLIGPNIELHTLSELPSYSAPPETGKTFEENARLKARTLRALKPGNWVVADDSGLEVDGLGGLPGVHSARYAGEKASDRENIAKLLKMIQIRSHGNRSAQMSCVLVAFDPTGQEHIFTGIVRGTIAQNVSGQSGFVYDPVFIPDGQSKTYAELGAAFKNQSSHRGQALRQLLNKMENQTDLIPRLP